MRRRARPTKIRPRKSTDRPKGETRCWPGCAMCPRGDAGRCSPAGAAGPWTALISSSTATSCRRSLRFGACRQAPPARSAPITVVTSSFGGWFAGALSDRFGRVRMLQIAILWYSVFTFLCSFAQNFEQLFVLRGLHGLGFGGEWATGAVLMGEVIRDKYRGRGVGFVQTCAAVGPGFAALVYAGLYAILPEAIAWRALFAVGILPALLV